MQDSPMLAPVNIFKHCACRCIQDGHVLQALYDPDGSHVKRISAVTEAGDRLYFGNLAGDYVSFIQKPPSV